MTIGDTANIGNIGDTGGNGDTGETLKARLARRPLPLAEALDLAAQIAAEIAARHARGVVYGSLEPAHVRISPEERVQLVDSDAADTTDAADAAYRSPEQLRGDPLAPLAPPDARTDVWSLGVILYEMLTGGVPFAGSAEEMARAILEEAPVALFLPGLPPALERIVEQALAKSPAARYTRIEEMRMDLLSVDAALLETGGGGGTRMSSGGYGGSGFLTTVLTGATVSHFRIAEPLGAGGMGVLYRAEDTRLGRTVALKFLAPELVREPVAKQRFLTEARAASALDHPNLCTILEIGETEGLLFLAMPLYEGEGLERRIARGPLPLAQALDITTQTLQGLAKAHRNGIIHRDIKPSNLFLTGDGVVKVLDFGIAKLTGEAGPTRSGSFLGTPTYMAPEQTRGGEIDARADVWSMGVVLYEMLAGRRPFAGGTDVAVVHAVLHRSPEPLSSLRPDVPEDVERIVAAMLAKDPEQRYRDAGEALVDLRRAQGLASATLSTGSAPGDRARRRATRRAILALALAAVAGAVTFLVWPRSGKSAFPPPKSFNRLTDLAGRETFPSLSPEGTYFVYAKSMGGNFDLFLQRVAGGSPINLTASSPVDDTQPAFSPNGQQIAFRSERDGGGIFLMGATGESVRRLTDFGFNPAWSADGREIAVATEAAIDPASRDSRSQIFLVDTATGARRSLGVADGVQPSWSPHGQRIAYWGLAQPGARRAIWTVPVTGGTPVPVVDDVYYNWSPVWSPDGRLLYFASNRGGSMNLWRVAVDEGSGAVLGPPQPITTPSEWSALPSFSRDGRLLLYATNDDRSFVEQVRFDPEKGLAEGPPSLIFQGARAIWSAELSPDRRWLVFRSSSPQEDLFLIRPDGSELRQLTNDPARDRAPRWSPDGRLILFSSNRSGKYEAWTIRPDGSNLTPVTNLPDQPVLNPFWSPDGRSIGFTYGSLGTALLTLGAPGSLRVLPRAAGGQVLARAAWSPDGRSLAGVLLRPDESPVPGIVLWSLADDTYRRLTPAGLDPEFLPSGKILFLDRGSIRLADATSGEARTLLPPPAHSSYMSASAGPDDRTLCTVRTTDEGDIWILSLGDPATRP
ncbi:MAG TPA: protein kinase [Thermoanaerobaculia bacterium]|nr:protein kinase [Thermoanaerobaculia bacterium]